MKELLALLALLLFAVAAFWFNDARYRHTNPFYKREEMVLKEPSGRIRKMPTSVETLRSLTSFERYIVDVINHGSAQKLGFAYGDMPAHMADAEAAPKIAAYVVTLSGQKPTHPEWVKEGRLFYVSNCGGCHGEDGKGIHGTFPDLTRRPLLGIERRNEGGKVTGKVNASSSSRIFSPRSKHPSNPCFQR